MSFERKRRRRQGALSSTAALLLALLAATAQGGCARRQPPAPAVVYPYSSQVRRTFFATDSGLSELTFQGEAEAEMPASQAPHASVLSSDGRVILVAVNGWGVERVELSPDGSSYRLADSPQPGFNGLTAGGAWPLAGGFLVQLYRDPFLERAAAPGAASGAAPSPARLFYMDAAGLLSLPSPFPPGLEAGFEPFAILPAGGSWFAELRKDGAERVSLKFFALDSPLGSSLSAREIRRADFESALSPLPLSALAGGEGASLRTALGALGRGPWLARLRSGAGEDRWYLSSGRPEEAQNVYAWSLGGPAGGERSLVLTGDGRLAAADALKASVTELEAPAPGAQFTALAASATSAAAAWEAGTFPSISSAGVMILPLPR